MLVEVHFISEEIEIAMNVKGYAALAVKEDLVPHSFVRREGAGRNRLTWCCTVVVCRYHHMVAVASLAGWAEE